MKPYLTSLSAGSRGRSSTMVVLAAKLLGVKLDVNHELIRRVTMVRIGVRSVSS